MQYPEENMSRTNCFLCFKNSAQIPLEYLQFSDKLLIKFFKELSAKTNRFKSHNPITFPFCSHCRIYLLKFAKLNDKLESLAGDLCQLEEKQKVKRSRILSVQIQVSAKDNDSQHVLTKAWSDQQKHNNNFNGCLRPPTEEILQPNEDSGACDIEIIYFGECNTKVASGMHGSLATDQILSENGDESVKVQRLAPTMKDKAVDPSDNKREGQASLVKVQKISEKDFICYGKYPFERTDFGFKCGSCSTSPTFKFCKNKINPIWANITKHIRDWHFRSDRVRKIKVHQQFIEIAPDRFEYGNYSFEKNENRWRCLTCDYLAAIGRGKDKFKYISFHINHKHENPGKHHMCELCGAQYLSSMALKYHKIAQHAQSTGSFPCSSCEKTFKSQVAAQKHENNFHKQRYHNHICEICGKRYNNKTRMQAHIAFGHHGEKIFKCNECGKAYSSKTALSRHENHHTGKHKYSCDICGMKFSQSSHVTRHKNTVHKNEAHADYHKEPNSLDDSDK